jgi:hypothetical protein
MLLRLQLQIELDTVSKETRIVNQQITEGEPTICPAPGCGKSVPIGRQYCSAVCFRIVGKRKPHIKRTRLSRPQTGEMRTKHDYSSFSFHQGVSV